MPLSEKATLHYQYKLLHGSCKKKKKKRKKRGKKEENYIKAYSG